MERCAVCSDFGAWRQPVRPYEDARTPDFTHL
jgi:hypothetical protein